METTRAMNGQRRIQRIVTTPGATLLLLLCGAVAVNAMAPEDMIATDGKVEVVDGKHIQKITREFSFEPGQRFRLENSNGRISVTGWDEDRVVISAEKRLEKRVGPVGWLLNKLNIDFDTSNDMKSYFEEIDVEVGLTEGGVEVETIRPKRTPNVNVNVYYEIKLPRETDVSLSTSNGRLHVENINGAVETRSSNGRVTAENIIGSFEARTSNGRITLTNVTGGIEAKTSNGAIAIEHPEPIGAASDIVCDTSNGSIRIHLAQSSSFDIDARTTNGRIHTDFDIAPEGRRSKRRLEGRVGEGGPLLDLETTNGSITIDSDFN